MDVETFEAGVVASLLTNEGDSAAVGQTVALLAAKESDLPALQEYGKVHTHPNPLTPNP